MAQYINKAAVAAEIERLADIISQGMLTSESQLGIGYFKERLLSFLDSLETKEVDLDYIKDELDRAVKIYKPNGNFGWGTLYNIATHFFELGLKTKGE